MQITTRSLWTLVHGMGFGALYLMACSGALAEIYRRSSAPAAGPVDRSGSRFLALYLGAMAGLSWLAVLSGTYLIYPWYRAVAPVGVASLAGYPQRLLLSNPATSG